MRYKIAIYIQKVPSTIKRNWLTQLVLKVKVSYPFHIQANPSFHHFQRYTLVCQHDRSANEQRVNSVYLKKYESYISHMKLKDNC